MQCLHKTCLYAVAMLLIQGVGFAQNNPCTLSISGYVLDEQDSSPLAFAEVSIRGLFAGTITDESGYYEIKELCPGKYTLAVNHIGCEPVTKVLELTGNVVGFNFYPEHHQELLEEAVIVKEKSRQEAAAKVQLSEVELESSKGKSIAHAIEQIGGVNTLNTGSGISKPVIHGLYGNRITTLNNGVQQEDQQWGLEHSLNIDAFTAENISVVKGVSAVQYGTGAIGGVVILNPAALPFQEKFIGTFYAIGETNGRGGSSSLQVHQGLGEYFAYRAQISAKRLGDRSAPDYVLSNTATSELNGSFELGYKRERLNLSAYYSHFSGELGILRASHIGNVTDLQLALNSDRPTVIEPFTYSIGNPRQEISHDLAKLEAKWLWNEKTLLRATYAFQLNRRKEFDVRRGVLADVAANNLSLKTNIANLFLERNHTKKLLGKFGVDLLAQENSNSAGTGVRPILPNYNKYQAGVFIIEKWQSPKWILEAGLRYDYQDVLAQKRDINQEVIRSQFNFSNWAASAGATKKFNSHWEFSTLLSYAYRPPHVNELLSEGLHHGAAVIEEGDIDLVPEKSLNWSNTLSINYAKKWQAELTAYANTFDGYIYLRPQSELRLTNRGAFPVQQYTQTDALLAGVDLRNEIVVSPQFTYKIVGSWIYGWDRSEGDYLVLMPPAEATHSIRWERKAVLKLSNPFVEFGQHLVAEQQQYPEIENVPAPPTSYQTLFVSIGASTTLFKRGLDISLSAENILNNTYRSYLNRQRYFADELGFNFLIKIKYQF